MRGQIARVLPAVLAGIAEEKSKSPLFPMSGGGGHGYKWLVQKLRDDVLKNI